MPLLLSFLAGLGVGVLLTQADEIEHLLEEGEVAAKDASQEISIARLVLELGPAIL